MKVCIDAGHNDKGFDTGASGNGLREQDVNFEVAHKLADLLRNNGIEVIETRPTKNTNLGYDLNSSLKARSTFANDSKADYFISIHCNAGGGIGTETYISGIGGNAEKIAKKVNSEIVNTLKTTNRGVKVNNLYVLNKTDMPAVLIELGFIDNVYDSEKLRNKQDDFATSIAKGFLDFLGIAFKGNETAPESKNQYSYDNTVEHMIKLGITTTDNMAYWEKCLTGTEALNKDNVRAIFDRFISKIYEK